MSIQITDHHCHCACLYVVKAITTNMPFGRSHLVNEVLLPYLSYQVINGTVDTDTICNLTATVTSEEVMLISSPS